MRYQRILPRDLFNDANLLKCMGQVACLIHDRKLDLRMKHRHPDKDFRIKQNESDGSTYVENLTFELRTGWTVRFWRPMNSRDVWPLYAHVADSEEDMRVFDEHGGLLPEFIQAVKHGHTLPAPI